MKRMRAIRGIFWALAGITVAMAGCAGMRPGQPQGSLQGEPSQVVPLPLTSTSRAAEPAARGEVLARGERFLVYQPAVGDSLRSVAARFLGSEDRDWTIAEFNGIDRIRAGEPVVVPLRATNAPGVRAGQLQTVPILCYHRFGEGGGRMSVSPANFAAQLDWLSRNDYHVIRLSQLVDFLEGRDSLPRRSVVITIDDGYESAYRYAIPLLRRYGFPATLFVYTDFIGGGDALNWSQLRELVDSGLVELGAHSKSHHNLIERPDGQTDAQYRQRIEIELRTPRDVLEAQLPTKIRYFSFPYGDANAVVVDVLRQYHYQLAFTVNPGGNPFFSDPMLLRRTMIFGDYDLAAFKSKLQVSRNTAAP
jgi:peptidoglycan/xylan/chitin deacetylase (PgdA/CDA1 family)